MDIMSNFLKLPHPWQFIDTMVLWIAQGLGSGRSPWAPGTVGTMLGVVCYWHMASWPLLYYAAVTALLFGLGIPICGRAAAILQQSDPKTVVWDEIVGYLITMLAVPPSLSNIVVGFMLFRLFDIWKPQPIAFIDSHIHGGLGIMLDDALAAVFALPLVHLLHAYGPKVLPRFLFG